MAERAGEKAHPLTACAILPEDLGSIPRAHVQVLQLALTAGARDPMPSSYLCGHGIHMQPPHIPINKNKS